VSNGNVVAIFIPMSALQNKGYAGNQRSVYLNKTELILHQLKVS